MAQPDKGKHTPQKAPDQRPAPSYDRFQEGYTGISTGVLDSVGKIHDARAFAEMIVDTIREGLLVLDYDLRVKSANTSFYNAFGVKPEETIGRLVYDLGNGQWDIPDLRALLEEILPHEKTIIDYEIEHDFENVGERVMLLNAHSLNSHELILLAIEDVTERRKLERGCRELSAKLADHERELQEAKNKLELQNQ
jgi:PAS domain S-box-containing protein